MISTNSYFNFMGNAEEAMNFYKTIFGGEFTGFQRFNDMPGCERLPPGEQTKMMHIALTTPKGQIFMATDALESMDHKLSFGNNSYTMLTTESEAETERLYNGLSAGGKLNLL
jgi:PhnB protein